MISNRSPEPHDSFPEPLWQHAVNTGNLDAPPVDSETAALFRAALCPVIDQSSNWPTLMDRLRAKGYGLAIRDGRLFLTNHLTGARVCSFRFLGLPLAALVARLGRPVVRALPGQRADGEVLRESSLSRDGAVMRNSASGHC